MSVATTPPSMAKSSRPGPRGLRSAKRRATTTGATNWFAKSPAKTRRFVHPAARNLQRKSRGFGVAFNVLYALVTLYVALRIHVEDRFTAVIAPPLVYAAAMFLGGFFDSEESTRTLRRVLENTFVNLSFGAPWLVGVTLATIVIAVVRGRRAAVRQRH